MKILIAPWGWPGIYKEAQYRVEDKIFPSNTATGALKKAFKPDYTILILQDSLAVYNPDTFKSEGYHQMVEFLKNFLFEKYISNPKWIPDFDPQKDVLLVAPNVGSFTNRDTNNPARLAIEGEMGDYYYWVLYDLSRLIFDMSEETEELTLLFDTSHGQNIMSYLTYSAIYNIASTLGLKLHDRVKLEIYNADPHLHGADYLQIHLVRKLTPKMQMTFKFKRNKFQPLKVNRSLVRDLTEEAKNLQGTFKKYENIYTESFLPFMGAFAQGIIHGILHFFPPDTAGIEDEVCGLYNSRIDFIPQGEDRSLVISRKLFFTEYFEALVYTGNLRRVMINVGINGVKEVNLEDLRRIAEMLYVDFPVVQSRILYEINHLQSEELAFCKTPEWSGFGSCRKEIHKRNFFAHAGFPKNSIEFKYSDGNYWIRFCEVSMETVLHYLRETVTIP